MTTALLILVPLSLVLLGVAVWVFFWAADDGQFDDLDTPAWKIVLDDDSKPPEEHGSPTNHRGSGATRRESRSIGALPQDENNAFAVRGHRAAPTEIGAAPTKDGDAPKLRDGDRNE